MYQIELKYVPSCQRYRITKQCPCGKSNRDEKFSPFVGYDDKGKCFSCDKVFWPTSENTPKVNQPLIVLRRKSPSFMPESFFHESYKDHDKNFFVRILINHFGYDIAIKIVERYLIGTSDYRPGTTIFWQFDQEMRIRGGKLMLYNEADKKRVKDITYWPHWVHKEKKIPDFNLDQCLYGEHQLAIQPKTKTIALFESEKSASIMSVYLPDLICLACGGSDGLSLNRCKALQGRNIVLYPDLNKFDAWRKKAELYGHFANFTIAEHTEKLLNGIIGKVDTKDPDICDYILYKFPNYPGGKSGKSGE